MVVVEGGGVAVEARAAYHGGVVFIRRLMEELAL